MRQRLTLRRAKTLEVKEELIPNDGSRAQRAGFAFAATPPIVSTIIDVSEVSMSSVAATSLDSIMAEMPAWGSEFARTYANHAPMVLVALDRLGGSGRRLRDFFDHYRDFKALVPVGATVAPIDPSNWAVAVGQRQREADLRVFFAGEVSELGIEGALRAYLPRLAPGVGASALHALMRTAYGLIREDPVDVGIALAYWAATYLEMPPATGAATVTGDPAEVLARVAAIDAMHGLPMHELLWQNMRESGRTPEFRPVVDWLEITPETPARLAAASIALFAATQDFCALHAVTGMHWMRLVLPHCPAGELLLRHFWQCVAALMGEMRFPVLPDAETLEAWRRLPMPDWEVIKAAAAQSYDEHDISLVFSASEEMKVYGDPLYQLAAARRVGLVKAYA
jgi:hypothetical protein